MVGSCRFEWETSPMLRRGALTPTFDDSRSRSPTLLSANVGPTESRCFVEQKSGLFARVYYFFNYFFAFLGF
jgi:hypothetical protein